MKLLESFRHFYLSVYNQTGSYIFFVPYLNLSAQCVVYKRDANQGQQYIAQQYKFSTIEIKDTPTPCLYHESKANPGLKDPHNHVPLPQSRKKICDTVLDLIGNTPLVRLNKVPQSLGVKAEILLKLEMCNPGGSVKDRIGLRMIEDFEYYGVISGDLSKHTVLEPTSGNTGIAVAMVAAVKGIKCITAMPQKFSLEKEKTLTILGSTCLRTPDGVPLYDVRSQFGAVFKYQCDQPETHHVCGQYINPSNPLAHYDWTAEEILRDTDGQLDYFFAGTGTGGTLSGCARKFRDVGHPVKIIAVDPAGSYLMPGNENNLGPFMVEGIGQPNFRPRSIDVKIVDDWVKIPDKESFHIARRVIKEEGIMIGGSAGAAIYGAIQYCLKNNVPAGKRCVVLCPDSIRSYISTFVTDSWMIDFKYMDPEPNLITGYKLQQCIEKMGHLKERVSIMLGTKIKEVIEILQNAKHDAAAIVDNQNNIKGGTCLKDIMFRVGTNRSKLYDPIDSIMQLRFRKVSVNDGMDYIMHAAETNYYVIVQEDPKITITPTDVAEFMALVK